MANQLECGVSPDEMLKIMKKKPKRQRVNIKDLHALPERLELVNTNMQLVALLAKSEAKNKKIFADAQAQLSTEKRRVENLKKTNQELVLEEARGALELERAKEDHEQQWAIVEGGLKRSIERERNHCKVSEERDKILRSEIGLAEEKEQDALAQLKLTYGQMQEWKTDANDAKERERALDASLKVNKQRREALVKEVSRLCKLNDVLTDKTNKHEQAMKDWRIFLIFAGIFAVWIVVLGAMFRL